VCGGCGDWSLMGVWGRWALMWLMWWLLVVGKEAEFQLSLSYEADTGTS
jgi:hypothetical protein